MDKLLIAAALALCLTGCGHVEEPQAPQASVSALMERIESGHLLARRRAIGELFTAAPRTGPEMERLLWAARQSERQRLRAAARAALARDGGASPTLEPFCGRLLLDGSKEVQEAGLMLCRRLGIPDTDPRIRAHFALRPHRRSFYPESLPAEVHARMRQWAQRVEASAAGLDPNVMARLGKDAAETADAAGLKGFLEDKTFLGGGLPLGREVARAGGAVLPRAEALLKGDDPLARETALGVVLYMRDPAARKDLERIAKGLDKEAASCAQEALAAMAKGN